jgi:preprotein translocase subunit YajC
MTNNYTVEAQDASLNSSEVRVENFAAEPKSIKDIFMSSVPYLLIFFVFYFLLIRPQETKRKSLEQLLKSLKKGETVITNGGIFGTIVKISDADDFLEIEVAKNTNIKILRSAIIDIPSRKVEK